MRLQNTYKEMDFDQRVKVEDVLDKEITITSVGSMTTKYGFKKFAELDTGKWFYLTDSLERIANEDEFPITGTITKAKSKGGNNYWKWNKMFEDEIVNISELENTIIEIKEMKKVNTKYGSKNLITLADGRKCFTNWEYLYDDMIKMYGEEFNETLSKDPLIVKVITKISKKSSQKYYTYKDISDEEFDIIADGTIPF